jgi:hypothetical protein
VAPGSAGEFLPGTRPDVRLVEITVLARANATYAALDRDLVNGSLTASDRGAMYVLGVQFVIVTGANSVLWPPFSPQPFLDDPASFDPVFEKGDAYLFELTTIPGPKP